MSRRVGGAGGHASYLVLSRVGHVPMIDDPSLVAETILASAGSAGWARTGS